MNMATVFTVILNRSFTAAYCVVVVVFLRFFLKKQPKIFSYLLWSVVFFRLLCPVSASGSFSLLWIDADLFSAEKISDRYRAKEAVGKEERGVYYDWHEDMGRYAGSKDDAADEVVLTIAEGERNEKQLQFFLTVCGWIWLAGVVMTAGYGIRAVFRLRHFLHGAVKVEERIYEVDGISTPFVFGMRKPCIYLPGDLQGKDRRYVLEHEWVHMARRDYLFKILAWIGVCIHWFNPCVWLAFTLLERDMEMSCDEAVLRKLGMEAKKEYSRLLLSFSCEKRKVNGGPIAFGEGNVRNRIRNILSYRRGTFVTAVLAAILLTIIVLGLSFDPIDQKEAKDTLSFGRKCQFVENYANAFCARFGEALVGAYREEETAFDHIIMLEKVDGEYTFGFSSPWPDEFRYVVREQENKEEALGEIWYYAWTSDPHVSVWKEEIVFEEVEDRYYVVDGSMIYLDQIDSKEEFEEAYLVAGHYDFLDYVEAGFVQAINYQTEYDSKQGDGTDRNAFYRNPETAAEWILNLTGGQSAATRNSDGRAVVTYTFADGESVVIPMCDVNYDSGTDFTVAENGEEPERTAETNKEVWILDLERWKTM